MKNVCMELSRTAPAEDLESLGRRRFHVVLITGLWGVIGAALATPAALFFLTTPANRSKAKWSAAGEASKLQPNVPALVTFQRERGGGWSPAAKETVTAWVVESPDRNITAFSPKCTHLGCAYHWANADRRFVCPCHGSQFGIDGHVLRGPATRPLDRYETKVEAGKLLIGPLRTA